MNKTKSVFDVQNLGCQRFKMSVSIAERFLLQNKAFLQEVKSAGQVNDNVFTLLPTVIFGLGTFAVIYKSLHGRSHAMTSRKLWWYRVRKFPFENWVTGKITHTTCSICRSIIDFNKTEKPWTKQCFNNGFMCCVLLGTGISLVLLLHIATVVPGHEELSMGKQVD